MKSFNTLLVCFLILISSFIIFSVAYAEGMKVKPGLWETRSVVTMPGGGTQEHTSQNCITKSEITPGELMKDAEGCEILNANVDIDSMQWTIRCQNAGVEMIGEGNAKSAITKITGGMKAAATFNDQKMVIVTKWEGSHLGACK